MSSESVHISIVVPCYKSQKSIKELCERLVDEVEKINQSFEILLINDGSPDNLLDYLKENVLVLDSRIAVVDLTRNFGQQSAILAGFDVAQGDYIVTIDDDLQQDPKDIKLLYDAIVERKDDVVVGSLKKKKHSFVRNLGTRMVKFISNKALGVPYDLDLTSFRIIRKQVAKNCLLFHNINPVVGFLLYMASDKFSNVKVDHYSRQDRSTYTFKKLIDYFMCMLINYSDLLLVFVGRMGLLVSLVSFVLGIGYFGLWAVGITRLSGFTTIVILQLFISGLIFITLGIIGAYLSRITKSSSRYPLYLVKEVIKKD